MLRNIMIRMTIGSPIIVGVMKEANKFSFILFLKLKLFKDIYSEATIF